MADNVTPTNPNAMTVDAGQEPSQAASVNTTAKGQQTHSKPGASHTVTVGGDSRDVPVEADHAAAPLGGEQADPGVAGDGAIVEGDAPTSATEGEDLGDYNPEDPEVAAKYDQRYFSEDGKLHLDNLSQEWIKNAQGDNPTGKLNEGTYKYLEERLGLTKDAIDRIGAGLEASNRETTSKFLEAAGGKDRWDAAIAWGKTGGYTKDQQDRFNAAIAKGGADAEDARDALMGRWSRARNKELRKVPPGAPTERRPANALKDAARGAAGSSTGGVQPFATREEASKAFRAISRKDDAGMAQWRKRIEISPPHVKN